MPDTNEIIERERQFLLQTYHRYPLVLQRGKGVFLYDLDGKRYLDFVAGLGVNALGHAHPRIVKVIREQAVRVIHLSNLYYNEFQGLLAEKLCRLSGLQRAFFSNSGTEAIEGSIKLARLAGHRIGGQAKSQLVGLEGSYHGRTFGAMYECSVDFLNECRALADQHRAALIFDEIQCGLGRTGTIFAFQSFGVTPDIVAIAKPIAAGLPLGAFLAKEEFASAISVGQHGTTFGGGPLACRVALEYLEVLEEEKLLENVARVGQYLREQLTSLGERSTAVREVRGRGFILGLQLDIPARPIVEQALGEGVLFNSTQDTVLRFLPPFLLQEKHVDKGVRVLKKLLGKAKKARDAAAAS